MRCRPLLVPVLLGVTLIGCGEDDGGGTGRSDEQLEQLGLTREVPDALKTACRDASSRVPPVAAARRPTVVYCPPLVPVGPVNVSYAGDGVGKSYFVDLHSPSLDEPESGGHWLIESGIKAELAFSGYKPHPVSDSSVALGAVRARVLRMPPYPEGGVHGGHVLVRWKSDDLVHELSVHGYEHEELAIAMAEELVTLMERCPPDLSDRDADCGLAFWDGHPLGVKP